MLDNNQNMLSDDDLDSVSGGTGSNGGGHYTISSDCVGCGKCSDACPVEAIHSGSPFTIDQSVCVGCGGCVAECPVDAIS